MKPELSVVLPVFNELEGLDELLAKVDEGFEVVYAVRTAREGEGTFKKLTARLFYRLIGVFGEYLGRIYEEIKGRPLYLVAEVVGDGEEADEGGEKS